MLTFGELIYMKRNSKQLSARELARRADLDPGYISKLEKSQAKYPSFPVVIKIAEELGITWSELSNAFQINADLVGGFDKYTESKVVGDERQVWKEIIQNIDEITDESEINFDRFASLLKDIQKLYEKKSSSSKLFCVISIHEDNLIRILKTPFLDSKFLYLYEALIGVSETDYYIIRGDVLRVPEYAIDPEVVTLRELWMKCKSIERESDKYGYYGEMARYLEKVGIFK